VVVEFLSPGTEGEDLGRFAPNPPESKLGQPPCKFEVYEQIVQVQNYIVYDEPTTTLRYFRLVDGQYQEQSVGQQNPRLWIPELEIGLGLWEGEFEGLKQPWLRWCDYIGEFFLTDTEAAIAQLRQTVKNLLNLGMPVPQIAQITGLSESEVQEMAN
jgi:hypothetical protein